MVPAIMPAREPRSLRVSIPRRPRVWTLRRSFGRSDRGARVRKEDSASVTRINIGSAWPDRQLRFRLQLRLHEYHLLADADDTDADGSESARCVRAPVRRWRQHGSRRTPCPHPPTPHHPASLPPPHPPPASPP